MEQHTRYPRCVRRVRALLYDSLIIPSAALAAMFVAAHLISPGLYSALTALITVFLLEPVMVSTSGGTIGHHLVGIEVQSLRTGKRIGLTRAIVRFAMKLPLGMLSLVTFFTSRRYQGIHDLVVGTVVVLNETKGLDSSEGLVERDVEEKGYRYPSRVRRVVVIALYNVLALVGINIFLVSTISEECSYYNQCGALEGGSLIVSQILWWVAVGSSIIMGWRCQLPGCRRKVISQ